MGRRISAACVLRIEQPRVSDSFYARTRIGAMMKTILGVSELGLVALVLIGHAAAQQPASPLESTGDVEVLTSGPLHEAFAEPVSLNATAAVVIKKQPPEPIEEIPPESKPGDDAIWIPGYWHWDDERDDFLWISGIWRVPAYGHRWVPGYWSETADGFRRISGFWASAEATEVSYVPEPPATLEAGPTTAAPSEGHFWVPGSWMYTDNRYQWRPGYWSVSQADWVWVPHRYVWTPRGCIFVSGYWDYPFARRGLPFCPVYFHRPVYRTAGYHFTPGVVVNVGQLHTHLFARPRYHHYYFGDYYADRYADRGFYPWHSFARWGGYDPYFQYLRVRERGRGRDWEARIVDRYRWYRENERERPARTFAELRERERRVEGRERRDAQIAATLQNAERELQLATRLRRVAEDERRQIAQLAQERREFAKERSRIERSERTTLRPGAGQRRPDSTPPTLKLPDAPEVARRPSPDRRDREARPDTARDPRGPNRPDQAAPARPDRPQRPDRTGQTDPTGQTAPTRPARR